MSEHDATDRGSYPLLCWIGLKLFLLLLLLDATDTIVLYQNY
jgi:hypothetical protein